MASLSLSVALLAIGAAATASACARGEGGPGARSTLLSASTPRPEATVPTSRTIDNAGFVDNGGRTSDMTGRSEMSGMRPTESGGERPTGTPGSGTPLPLVTNREGRTLGEGAGAAPSEPRRTAGGPVSEAVERFARARCDRETTCNRVGEGRPWKSEDSCVARQRERVGDAMRTLGCARGVDTVQLAVCLNAVRGQACDDRRGDLAVLSECASNALCAP